MRGWRLNRKRPSRGVVAALTGNRVVTHIEFSTERGWIVPRLKDFGQPDNPQELGEAMFRLNVRSVSERYPNESIETLPGTIGHYEYTFRRELCSEVQALKSLRCWLYQSCEGTAANDPLFQAMEAVANYLALVIVSKTNEYAEAEWDAA